MLDLTVVICIGIIGNKHSLSVDRK